MTTQQTEQWTDEELMDSFAELGYTFLANTQNGQKVYYIRKQGGGSLESFATLDELLDRGAELSEGADATGGETPTPTPTPTPTTIAQGPGNRNVGGSQTYAPGPDSSAQGPGECRYRCCQG